MVGIVYDHLVAVDSSAVIALRDPSDRYHAEAVEFYKGTSGVTWLVLNATSHELFTHVRYRSDTSKALAAFDFVRSNQFKKTEFGQADESRARALLEKYCDQELSFHDALCAAVMLREGAYRIFSFDRDFWLFGFEIVPGIVK